ncbi:hypothetical protein vseg_018098 [Gypsophila vaccaria]
MASKSFLLFALLATVALFVISHVAASEAHTKVNGIEDAKYGGYQGGGGQQGGGYQGGGGHQGGGYQGGGYQGGGGHQGGGYQGGGGHQGGGGYQGGGGGYQGGGGHQGGGGGYQGGGGGSHHGGGGGGYCSYGCCGQHNYRGVCLRCCGAEAQVEAKPQN